MAISVICYRPFAAGHLPHRRGTLETIAAVVLGRFHWGFLEGGLSAGMVLETPRRGIAWAGAGTQGALDHRPLASAFCSPVSVSMTEPRACPPCRSGRSPAAGRC